MEARFRPAGDKYNDRLSEVSFVKGFEKPVIRDGAMQPLPDLAVETKSPSDTYRQMSETATYYLDHGVQMVWLVYPEKQLIEILTSEDRQLLTATDTLEGGEVLPRFKVVVGNLFSYGG